MFHERGGERPGQPSRVARVPGLSDHLIQVVSSCKAGAVRDAVTDHFVDLRRRTSAVAAECSPESSLAGVGVAGFGPESSPALQAGRIVHTTECLVSFAQDDARRLEDRNCGIGVRIPSKGPESTIARPIPLVLRCITVISTVVLRQPLRACDAEICPRNHVALAVLDDQLRLDGDAANNMQDAKQRLPRGL